MADLSRRALLRSFPGAAAVTVVPVVAVAATVVSADLDIIELAARVMAVAKECDEAAGAQCDLDDIACDLYPQRPSKLAAKFPYMRETDSVEHLQAWFDDLDPEDVPYRDIKRRLEQMRAWEAERAEINERVGLTAAREHANGVTDLLIEDLVPTLTASQPATIAGIAAKAEAVVALSNWGSLCDAFNDLTASIVTDVRRLAGGANV